MTKPTKKAKPLSKTKQELRRLREFAGLFTRTLADHYAGAPRGCVCCMPEVSPSVLGRLRDLAAYALTGKKSPRLSNHEAVAADVKRLNALGPKGIEKFLAGE
jgi:hypothetical protein